MTKPNNTPPGGENIVSGVVGLIFLFLILRACSSSDEKPTEQVLTEAPAADAMESPAVPQLPAITGAALTAEAKKIEDTLKPYNPLEETRAPLSVRSWDWREEYSYAIVQGTVKNNTSDAIDNLEAVVEFTDASGNFITSGSTLVEFRPLMPGQSSPFKVIESYNPMMKSANLRFKELMGGEVAFDKGRPIAKPAWPFAYNVQMNLMTLKFSEASPDGVVGKGTRNAISAFEKAYGLPITGQPSKFVNAASEVASSRQPLNP